MRMISEKMVENNKTKGWNFFQIHEDGRKSYLGSVYWIGFWVLDFGPTVLGVKSPHQAESWIRENEKFIPIFQGTIKEGT